jgi:hypothetical protein
MSWERIFGQISHLIEARILYLSIPNINSLAIARVRCASSLTSIICEFLMFIFGAWDSINWKVSEEKYLSSDRLLHKNTNVGYI